MKKKQLNRYLLYCATLMLLWAAQSFSLSLRDKQIYDSLGLSETEWMLVKEHDISMTKLNEIMRIGVSVRRYCDQPWHSLRLEEKEYLELRGSGYSHNDIIQMQSHETDKDAFAVIHNFFLPGYHQYKRGQYLKGACMTAIPVVSLGLFALHRSDRSESHPAFDYPAYLLLCVSGMLWSSIDIGVQQGRKSSAAQVQFGFVPGKNTKVRLELALPIKKSDS